MQHSHAPQALVTIAILALIAWRLYYRIRRTIGRQRLSPARPWVTVVLFPLVVVLLAWASRTQPLAGAALAGGVALGIGLGLIGLRLTRFERTAEGLYYTPSAHLGIALSALLVCRIAWRFMVNGLPAAGAGPPPPAAALGPLTLLLVGTLAGYYVTYAVGLLRWSLSEPQTPPAG
jgi:hypothetical protein